MAAILDEVRLKLQKEIVGQKSIVEPLSTDRWMANSLLQKAIRRGEVHVARRAALTFLQLGGSAIWRRLIIIAFEDVGASCPDVVAMIVAASTDAGWRKRSGGNALVATCLARLLAEAPKSRSAEHLITTSEHHPVFDEERRIINASSTRVNLDAVADVSKSRAFRALAAWRASGIGWNGEKVIDKDLPGLLDTFGQLGVPQELVEATGVGATASREPITLMVPLLWLAAHQAQEPTTVHLDVPRSSVIDGIPNYALDQHTRTGREAIRELVKYNFELRECLERYVPRPQRNDAAYMAAFYADAAPLARKLVWRGGDELEALGTEADLLKVGVAPDGIAPLLQVLRENVDQLDKIRTHTQETGICRHRDRPNGQRGGVGNGRSHTR